MGDATVLTPCKDTPNHNVDFAQGCGEATCADVWLAYPETVFERCRRQGSGMVRGVGAEIGEHGHRPFGS
jgi:hypothetical protein